MLRCERLVIRQGEFLVSADLEVATSARVAILGPSGAGKTTLLMAIAGFVPPSQGRILVDGTDITQVRPGKRPTATVFQDNNLFPHLTVRQNVSLALDPSLRLSPAQMDEVTGALERVGLQGMAERRPGTLSGGQQARVTLSRVLLQRRAWLLLDEPFAALGPGLRAEMLGLVTELSDESGAGVLMITHDPRDAAAAFPQTIVVADGIAGAPAPTAEILENPPPALARYLGT